MTLQSLLRIFTDKHCKKVYVKSLSQNDNSKNQVYLGSSFDILNILPIQNIVSDNTGKWEHIRFKSKIDFYWVTEEGILNNAPNAQLILYPNYPEVRFSGFLKGATNAPSHLMSKGIEGRLLFMGVTTTGQIIGHVVAPDSCVFNEFLILNNFQQVGVFKEITIQNGAILSDPKEKLLTELKRIHLLGWINAKRLNSSGNILPCVSSNCGGYTLEAELGISPNGYAEPDYLGWEIKQFTISDFSRWQSAIITLMTPEPTHGYYVDQGPEAFIRKYGYNDKLGREARMNFGGIHKFNAIHASTGLKLIIEGIDNASFKITNTEGFIGLVDKKGNIAASWAFASMLKHWTTKHANACFVPSKKRIIDNPSGPSYKQQYCYGNEVILGQGTDFSLVLHQIAQGNIYYDPGIKLELAIQGVRKQAVKRRNQFRIKSVNLHHLYKMNEIVDTTN